MDLFALPVRKEGQEKPCRPDRPFLFVSSISHKFPLPTRISPRTSTTHPLFFNLPTTNLCK